jgi:diguanylate cyclase (GGDEF)-like protein
LPKDPEPGPPQDRRRDPPPATRTGGLRQVLARVLSRIGGSISVVDPVTGLVNERTLREHLQLAVERGQRRQQEFALFLVDLDRFRVVDSSLGRAGGDAALGQIARRIEECVRPGDLVARLGGDEFALLLSSPDPSQEAEQLALRVMERIKQPLHVGERSVVVTATVGFSVYPRDGATAEALLKAATHAIYAAKERGDESLRRYTSRLGVREIRRLAVESGLRLALEKDELLLHYQPIAEIATGSVSKVEALVRWRNPAGEIVPPGEFIPIAEGSSLILALDEWVLRTACSQIAALGDTAPGLGVSVNVSGRTFAEPGLPARVRSVLDATGLAPSRLALEVTEGTAMQDIERGIALLRELRELGLSLSIDDFGTGYSSLTYLRRLPVQAVKLDRAFVKDLDTNPEDAAIARAVIAMSRSLGLAVIAEGVETHAQLAFLEAERCDAIQGYLLSKPVERDGLVEFLSKPPRPLREI